MEKAQISPREIEKVPMPQPEPSKPKAPPKTRDLHKHFPKPLPEFSETTEFHRGSRSGGVGYPLIAWSFLAAFIDALILIALSCFFLVSLSLLVHVPLRQIFEAVGGMLAGISACGILIGFYMILLRSFLGFTIGEWACGLRLGSLGQRLHRFYSLKVILRTVLIFATGFVVFPVLSMLLGRDLMGLLIRLPLIQVERTR